MAQAARLSLRMQKELKLLLTDPPPGASFPLLSDSDLSSLTSIDADIEGPDGTVYENGVFRVKIQIPERYPFQPPSVTFATPIYHPNIDNGGRICLDILNLPPKGAWQPSLNISTVITSIGLLLSEPNPDDGLMCEASKEYKYNRQAFDQKARFMTQKHAKAGASGSIISSSSDSPAQLNSLSSFPSSMKTEGSTETLVESHCSKTTQKKSFGLLRRKLSLESSKGSTDIAEVNKVVPDTEPGGTNNMLEKENGNSVNQMEKMNRVEQGSSLQETAAAENTTLQVGKPCVIESTPPSAESSYSCQMRKEQLMKPDVSDSSRGNEKIGSRSRKLSLGLKGNSFQKFEGGNKENQVPIRKLQLSRPRSTFGTSMSPPSDLQGVNDGESRFKSSTTDVLKPKPREKPVDEDESARDAREAVVIVLDSEDSDEEDNRCSRRAGLLTRKRIRHSDLKFPTAT